MEYTEVYPGIREYKIATTDLSELERYIALCTQLPLWTDSLTMDGIPSYRTSQSLRISMHKTHHHSLTQLDQLLFKLFHLAIHQYIQDFDVQIANDEGYEILKYTAGQGYKKHIDQGGYQYGRILSGLLYINDNYTGGHLEFTKLNTTIQPKRGTILLFPSNFIYEHIAHPVEQGEKIAVVTFFHPQDEIDQKKLLRLRDPHGASNL